MTGKIIVIDDDESIRKTIANYLTRLNYNVKTANNGLSGLELIKSNSFDLVISDVRMPGLNGLELLQKVKEIDSNIQVIIITAHDDMQTTIKAMQYGAYDYLEKPLEVDRLKFLVSNAIENKKLSEELSSKLIEQDTSINIPNIIVGKTTAMKEVYKTIGKISSSRVTVLLQGESGTGKELVARSIHYSGITKNLPFIAINCTALTESLLESELFGHEKGAFTGSIRDKKGKFELAGEGTIFLDEISEMSPNLQVKLLRVLQEREFEKVGSENIIAMKARIIAATNKDLDKLVVDGIFREDLYYRLKVVSLELPPLRNRKEDIPLLVNHFLSKINKELHKNVYKITDDVMHVLQNYNWFGNVRELENTLTQAVVLTRGDVLQKESILINDNKLSGFIFEETKNFSLHEVEKRHIKLVLDSNNWNKQKAAEILQISLPTLYAKIENYQLKQ
ncbi:MAG: sigma-54 dependent transcriptional regulator [bacterium]